MLGGVADKPSPENKGARDTQRNQQDQQNLVDLGDEIDDQQ